MEGASCPWSQETHPFLGSTPHRRLYPDRCQEKKNRAKAERRQTLGPGGRPCTEAAMTAAEGAGGAVQARELGQVGSQVVRLRLGQKSHDTVPRWLPPPEQPRSGPCARWGQHGLTGGRANGH